MTSTVSASSKSMNPMMNDQENESSIAIDDGDHHQNIPKSELITKSVQQLKDLGVPHEFLAKKNLSTLDPTATVTSEDGRGYPIDFKLPNKKGDHSSYHYYCGCSAYKFQKRPIPERTCKHIRMLRGDLAEDLRIAYAADLSEQEWNLLTDEQKQKKQKQREKAKEYRQKKRQREQTTKSDEAAAAFEKANEADYADNDNPSQTTIQKRSTPSTKKGEGGSRGGSRGGGGKRRGKKAKTDELTESDENDHQQTPAAADH